MSVNADVDFCINHIKKKCLNYITLLFASDRDVTNLVTFFAKYFSHVKRVGVYLVAA